MPIEELGAPFQKQKPLAFSELVWTPLFSLLFLFAFDYWMIPQAVVLPPMLFLLLGYLSFRLPVRTLLIWVIIYAAAVLIMLRIAPPAYAPATPFVRAASFVSGGLVIILITAHRENLEKSNKAFFEVVSALPLAVIVSNISGDILLLNKEARRLLATEGHDLVGLSFFSTFIVPDQQGIAIERYFNFFKQNNQGPHAIMLQTRGKQPRQLYASLSVLGSGKQQYAITVINNVEEISIPDL